jgi:hypothetical protein
MVGIKSAAAEYNRGVFYLIEKIFRLSSVRARLVVARLELNERQTAVAGPRGQVPALLSNTKDACRHGFLRKKRRSVLAERSQIP